MPTITAFPDPARYLVRVEVDWSDTPAVEYAKVLRYNPATGECVPLRPYICYDGDYLLLSCGHGIFHDTEMPLDTEFYYITEGLDAPCIPDPDPCVPCTPVTADTSLDPTTVASNGGFWLRDPVRPCNDRRVPLCFTQANSADETSGDFCIPGSGIFFASMDVETRDTNTLVVGPTNAKYPIAITRQRRGISSILTLVTRTFTDRDDLINLNAPGSPLFWQGPANYGIPDQYMSVAPTAVERGLSNHKFQVRVNQLPYVEVARPAGPSQGTCGSQVQDYCDFTWGELQAGGFTWDDLIRGTPNGVLPAYRTWDDVQADFADWNAVDNGTRTWTDLEVGN
jgi:hypothetical protein